MEIIQLIDKAIEAAILAGIKIREIYSLSDFSVQIKADHTPVTIADQLAHDQIIEILEETALPVLSEEGVHLDYSERKKWESFWLVDPLDGTKEFIKRNGEFTVNIALIVKNTATAGVIYSPISGDLYVAISSSGAFRLENPLAGCTFQQLQEKGTKLASGEKPEIFTVVTSRSHQNSETLELIGEFESKHGAVQIINRGSSLKLCMIAEGTANIYPKIGKTMEWDTAAGHAILKAVGKNIFHIDLETELTYNKENLQNPNFIAV